MQFKKFGMMLAAATIAAGAFADAANVLISFSTEADFYADGTAVKDGEWYALCWSANETFGGLTLECEPVVDGDRVLILAPLAKDGCCPEMFFQVDSKKAPEGGNYFVYLLDTRDATSLTPAGVATTATGRKVPAGVVNGSAEAQSFAATSSAVASLDSTTVSGAAVASTGWAPVQPKITAFEVKGATVKITVVGMMSGCEYRVNMGKTLDDMKTCEIKPKTDNGEACFFIDADDARFFKVVAE